MMSTKYAITLLKKSALVRLSYDPDSIKLKNKEDFCFSKTWFLKKKKN